MIELTEFERKLIDPACNLRVIAQGLARIGRFGGRGRFYYPVLAHSFVVGDFLPWPWKIYGYLHDMAEVLVGDVGNPFKTDEQKMVESAIHSYMLEKLGILYPSDAHVIYIEREIKKLDRETACAEAYVLQLLEIMEVEGMPDVNGKLYRATRSWANVSQGRWFSDDPTIGLCSLFVKQCRDAIHVMKTWPNTKVDNE